MRVLQAILISLMIHFLLAELVRQMPVPPKHNDNISIEIVSPPSNQAEKQIVREALVPEKLKVEESEDPLKFWSAQNQRVRKQTQAAINGMTKNRGDSSHSKKQTSKTSEKPNPLEAFAQEYQKLQAKNLDMDHGVSTIGEALPNEVDVGSFTALNTDRYLFYSFFSRIEDLIRYRWESGINHTIDTTPPSQFNNVSNTWTTNVEIWLKANGEYQSAHIMKESGIKGFDQAAVQAFIQARLFPNPPHEMVEADGLIHLKYAFRVYHKPTLMGRSNGSQNQ